MRIISVRNVDDFTKTITPKTSKKTKKNIESILIDVQKNGNEALKKYEKRFNGATIGSFRVSKSEIQNAYSKVTKQQIAAIKIAKKRLEKLESLQKNNLKNIVTSVDGTKIKKSFIPINSVGCYIPGGLAQYPSSVIMSVVPAKIAGVKKIVAVSPPNKTGKIESITLVAAHVCGVDEFYKIGGAQAIAALSFGTKSIPQVDKIVGPGSSFVTTAKLIVSENTDIDMIAGPTELAIIADNSVNPEIICDDLISQAEHSKDSFCYMITTSEKLARDVRKCVDQKIKKIKRSKIVQQSLNTNGFLAICKNQSDVIQLANKLAPEHLQIITKNSKNIATKIKTAGLVLIGSNTPSSASDYLLGSNHILPTNGFGRTRGSLSVLDFMKINTQIESSKSDLRKIAKYLKALTAAEDLPNHYEAVRNRLA